MDTESNTAAFLSVAIRLVESQERSISIMAHGFDEDELVHLMIDTDEKSSMYRQSGTPSTLVYKYKVNNSDVTLFT